MMSREDPQIPRLILQRTAFPTSPGAESQVPNPTWGIFSPLAKVIVFPMDMIKAGGIATGGKGVIGGEKTQNEMSRLSEEGQHFIGPSPIDQEDTGCDVGPGGPRSYF